MKYQWKQRIRYSEVDGERKLTIPNLVNYFQDCSTFQSEELGVGCEYMEEHQKAWVLSFWQIVIERRPKLGEEVTVETFAIFVSVITVPDLKQRSVKDLIF